MNKGFSLDNLGKTDEAIRSYERAISLNPANPVAWNNKGYALVRLEEFESVLDYFEKATQLDPKFERAWINRGLASTGLVQSDLDRASPPSFPEALRLLKHPTPPVCAR